MDFNPFEPQVKTDSILLNNAIGVGTSRDKMAGTTVNPGYFSTRLSLEERSALFAGDSFIHKLCAAVPTKAATRGWYCKITDDDGDDVSDEVEEYRKGLATNSDVDLTVDGRRFNSIEDLFRIAQVFANYQDGALLILNIDDGRPPHEPVNHKGIRRIAGIEVVSRRYCRPSLESASNVLDPVFYELVSLRRGTATIEAPNDRLEGFAPKKAGDGRVKIHCSRVIRFDGSEPLDETYVIANEGWYGNQIDRVWDYYKCWKTGQDALGSTLADSSLFVYKLRGLGNMIAQGKQGSISKRLAILTQNASMNGGVALDADAESIEYSSRQQNGVADILESFKNVMVGATGLPHTILLGDSPSGLGATGESEQQQLQELVTEQQILWKPGIERLYRLIFLSKDGPTKGKIPEQWEVVFKPLREQNETERIQNLSAFVNVLATGVGSAFLTAEEARASFDGEAEFNIKLDEKAWQEQKKKEEEQMGGGALGGGDFGGGEFGAEEAAPVEEVPAEEVPTEEEQVQTDSRLDSEVSYEESTQFTIVAEVPNYETEAWKAATHRFAVLDSAYAQDYMRDAAIEMERMDKSIADRHGLTKKKIRGKDGVTRTYWVKKGLLESPKRRYFGKSNYITGGGNKYITGKDDNTEKLLAIGVGSALLAGGVGLIAWEQQRQKEMNEFDRRRAAAVNNTPRPGSDSPPPPPPAPAPTPGPGGPRPGTPSPSPQSPPPPPPPAPPAPAPAPTPAPPPTPPAPAPAPTPAPPPTPPAPAPSPAPAASPSTPRSRSRQGAAAPSSAAPRVKVSKPKNAAYQGQFFYERGAPTVERDGDRYREYEYESDTHGTVPVLGRLKPNGEVNGGYYEINGVQTAIEKGRLSAIGRAIDSTPPPPPPTPPAAPPPSPPAPPATSGPSSTPPSPNSGKGRSKKPSAPSGGSGGPAAVLPPVVPPPQIVAPPRQRPSAITGLGNPNQAAPAPIVDPNQTVPPPGQVDVGLPQPAPIEPDKAVSGDPTVFRLGQDEKEFVSNYPVRLDVSGSPHQTERAGAYLFRNKKVGEDVIEVSYRQLAAFEKQDGTYSKRDFDPDYYIRNSGDGWGSRYNFEKHPSSGYLSVSDRARLSVAVARHLGTPGPSSAP